MRARVVAALRRAGFRTEGTRPAALNAILDAAALCFAAACTQAVVSAASIGGPLAYRVTHRAPLWKAGERPRLEQRVIEGDPKLSI